MSRLVTFEIKQESKSMNQENASKLWKIIQEAGDYLKGQLPDHPNHPKGRNPYAHVALCVKQKFSSSYKDIPDEKFEFIIFNDYRILRDTRPQTMPS